MPAPDSVTTATPISTGPTIALTYRPPPERAIASATQEAPAGAGADECFATHPLAGSYERLISGAERSPPDRAARGFGSARQLSSLATSRTRPA